MEINYKEFFYPRALGEMVVTTSRIVKLIITPIVNQAVILYHDEFT